MKRALALLVFLAAPVGATVIVDTTSIPTIQNTVGYSSWTMTVGTGVNRAVAVGCSVDSVTPLAVSSVTVGASTASVVVSTANNLDRAEIWIATGVASGANVIKVYFSNTYTDAIMLCGAVSFENVNLVSPTNVSSGTVNIGTMTFTTTVATTTLVDVAGQGSGATIGTPNTGQTLQWAYVNLGRLTSIMASTKDGGAAGSKIMGWTLPDATHNAMAMTSLRSAVGAPNISTLSPATNAINTGSFVLTVNGDNFASGSTVTWNGLNRTTAFVNSTQLTVTILSTDVVNVGQFPIRVINPDTSRSSTVNFSVTGDITKIWATDGGYKPAQEDLYGTDNSTTVANTRMWDGTTITPFQARNETNGIALVLENNTIVNSTMVTVGYPILTGPGGYVISSTPVAKANLWDWRTRPIQMYYVRYLPILGLGKQDYEDYDEHLVPERFQATCTPQVAGNCLRTGGWTSRPDHDKHYPDILVPFEAMNISTFTVASSSSQVVWVDIYVPKAAPAGLYTGSINVYEGTQISTTIPIRMTVYPFTMPDVPTSKPYAYLSIPNVNLRQNGNPYPTYAGITSSHTITRMRYYQELWRNGITPIGDAESGGCGSLMQTGPCPEFQAQLNGTLFDPTSGYANAPGIRTPVPVYMMFSYGAWRGQSYWPYTSSATCTNANLWVNWFQKYSPNTKFWWYMEDEPTDITGTSAIWSQWVSSCTAPGNQLKPYLTIRCDKIDTEYPGIKHCATTEHLQLASVQEAARKVFETSNDRRITFYNGYRPGNGTMATEDDGVAPRVLEWVDYKKKFDHHFEWETTNYTHASATNSDLFNDALTFGYYTSDSGTYGRTGFSYSNGEGVLIYPGTDTLFPADSYGADVPFPSWRLKMWRRGINDHTYLTMAAQFDATQVDTIVQTIIPSVLWERGVVDVNDPTYQYGSKSWSSDPNVWELARESLANIISYHR